MSAEAVTWAFRQELKMTPKFVLVALADYADEHHSCYPAHRKIAQRIGASPSTVKRALAELEEGGFVRSVGRLGENGKRTSNRYVLNVLHPPVQSDPMGQSDLGPRSPVTYTPGHSYDLYPRSPVTQQEPTLYPSPEPSPEREARKRTSASQGARLPEGWMPSQQLIGQMRAERSDVDLELEHRKFTDYWLAQPGQRGRKADWEATWRNWIRNARPDPQRSEYKPGWQKRLEHAAAENQKYQAPSAGGLFEIRR